MRVLTHKFEKCSGDFMLTNTDTGKKIQCDRCRASYHDIPSNRISMAQDILSGALLSSLTAEGAYNMVVENGGSP